MAGLPDLAHILTNCPGQAPACLPGRPAQLCRQAMEGVPGDPPEHLRLCSAADLPCQVCSRYHFGVRVGMGFGACP